MRIRPLKPRPTSIPALGPRALALLLSLIVLAGFAPASAGGSAGTSAASAAGSQMGNWLPPANPLVLRAFDPPAERWLSGHRGVDLMARPGMPVRSPSAGVIRFAGEIAGRDVLVIEHGTLRSTFEPVTSDLPVGTPVEAGEVVGRISAGSGHCGDADCLHWGVILGDTYLDPLALLGSLRPRLLPLVGEPE